MEKKSPTKKQANTENGKTVLPLVVAVIGIAVLFSVRFFKGSPDVASPTPEISSTPLAHGRQVYYISSKEAGPKPGEFVIDPLDALPGEAQAVEVALHYDSAISAATVTIVTDTKSQSHELTRMSGTETEGRWRGEWTLQNDTYGHNYQAIIQAKGADGTQSQIVLTFR